MSSRFGSDTQPIRYVRLSRPLSVCLAFGLAVIVSFSTNSASASHYYLADLEGFSVTRLNALRAKGIQTTEHFLKPSITAEDRKRLSVDLNYKLSEVTSFALECELLQVDGVGPKMVKLLRAAGVTGVDDFSKRNAQSLLMRLDMVNQELKVMEQLPPEGFIYRWIKLAGSASLRLSY